MMFLMNMPAYAESAYTTQEQADYVERTRMLQSFNILDNTIMPDISSTVTRAEFCVMITKILGYNGVDGTKSAFSDVNEKTSGYRAIGTISNLGYLKGYSDGTFRPDEAVKYEEAVKVFVCVLGYEKRAELRGGYPNGYIITAQELKIINNVEGYTGYPITNQNITKMIINSLDIDFMMQTTVGSSEEYSVIRGKTILSEYLKLEKRRGIIQGNDYTKLMESAASTNGWLCIDGVSYKVEGNYNNLLGYTVDFYVDTEIGDTEIRFIGNQNKLNDILTINDNDIIRYSNREYTYYKNGNESKEYKEKVPASAYVIINGEVVSSYKDEEMMPAAGYVTLVDNNKDGNYDVINVLRYEHYVVHSVDLREQIIYDKFDTAKVLKLDTNSSGIYVSIYDTTGKRMNIEGFKEWDVLSVARSGNGKVTNIILSRQQAEGAITQIDSNIDNTVTINDKTYEILEGYEKYLRVELNKFGVFYLNKDGKITAFINKNTPNEGFAFLIKAQVTSSGVSQTGEYKLLDSENNMRYLKGAEKINVDTSISQNAVQVIDLLKKGTDQVVPQVIKYRLNPTGDICEIDTVYNMGADYATATPQSNDDPMGLRITYSTLRDASGIFDVIYRGNHMTFRGKVNINSKTVIFRVPRVFDGAEDEDFSVEHTNYFKHDFNYAVEAYSASENTLIAESLIISEATANETDLKVGAVSKITNAVNEDGDKVVKLQLQNYMGMEEVYTEEEDLIYKASADNAADRTKYSIKVGDVVKYFSNSKNKLTGIKLLIDSDGNFNDDSSVVKFANSEDYVKMDRMYYGHVYERQEDVVSVSRSADLSVKPTDMETQRISGYKVLLFDTNSAKPKFNSASVKDLFDYKHSRESRSNVFLFTEYADQRLMVIYK